MWKLIKVFDLKFVRLILRLKYQRELYGEEDKDLVVVDKYFGTGRI